MTTANAKRPRAAAAAAGASAAGKKKKSEDDKGNNGVDVDVDADDVNAPSPSGDDSSDLTSSSSDAYSSDTSDDDSGDSGSGSDDEGSSGGDGEADGGETKTAAGDRKKREVVVDFEFYDPKPVDFHGLKALLNTWLDGAEYDASGLCDAVIAQSTVGTVVKTEEGGDPIGVVTCLDARRASDVKKDDERHVRALAQLRDYLVSCAPSPRDASNVEAAFAAGATDPKERHTGVVVSERLLNVPPALASPLQEALFDEIEWATEDEPTQELRESFGFGRYLVFSRVWLDDGGDGGDDDGGGDDGGGDDKRKKKKAKGPAPPVPSPSSSKKPVVVFARPEDQFFSEAAEWSFVFEPPKPPESSRREERPTRKGELRRARLVACVPASEVRGVREKLRKALDFDAVAAAAAAGAGGG